MKDWRSLKSQRSPLIDLMKGVAFLAALGAGLYLGWGLFFTSDAENPPGGQYGSTGFTESTSTVPVVLEGNGSASVSTPTPFSIEAIGTRASVIGEGVMIGSHPPAFTLQDLDGLSHALVDHQGHVVLINFWTTWCPPCRDDMPALQRAYEKFADEGFIVLGVNWTALDDLELIPQFVDELGITFPILLDLDGHVSEELYRLLSLPTSVFVGRDGIIDEIIIGALQLETLEDRVTKILEGRL